MNFPVECIYIRTLLKLQDNFKVLNYVYLCEKNSYKNQCKDCKGSTKSFSRIVKNGAICFIECL